MTNFLLGNIKGPKGDKGEKGDQGIQGLQGDTSSAETLAQSAAASAAAAKLAAQQIAATGGTVITDGGIAIPVIEKSEIIHDVGQRYTYQFNFSVSYGPNEFKLAGQIKSNSNAGFTWVDFLDYIKANFTTTANDSLSYGYTGFQFDRIITNGSAANKRSSIAWAPTSSQFIVADLDGVFKYTTNQWNGTEQITVSRVVLMPNI